MINDDGPYRYNKLSVAMRLSPFYRWPVCAPHMA